MTIAPLDSEAHAGYEFDLELLHPGLCRESALLNLLDFGRNLVGVLVRAFVRLAIRTGLPLSSMRRPQPTSPCHERVQHRQLAPSSCSQHLAHYRSTDQ
jgi:hypothetical protein